MAEEFQALSDMESAHYSANPDLIKAEKERRKKAGLDPVTGLKADPFQAALEAARKRIADLKNQKFEYKAPEGRAGAKKMVDPSARFERLRSRAKQEQTAATQAQKEALARRFAALGQTGSGAQIKVEQQAEQAGQKQLGRAMEGIANIEEQEALQRQQIQEQRDFAASEAEKGRQFSSQMFEQQRLAGLETLGLQQEFAAEQAKLGREFQSSEALKARQQQAEQFKTSFDESIRQFSEQMDLAQQQFAEEIRINNENLKVRNKELDKADQGLLTGLIQDIWGGNVDFSFSNDRFGGSGGNSGGGLFGIDWRI